MNKSIDNVNTKSKKKMGRPVSTGKGELIGVRILPELMTGLDAWAAKQKIPPSRPAAIRQILSDYLRRRGFLTI